MLKEYYITELFISNGIAFRHKEDHVKDDQKPITLTLYGGLDRSGNETNDRRLIISGGNHDLLFAVFNRDEFISIRQGSDHRMVFTVRPPGNFWGKYFYSMKVLLSVDETPENFMEEMSRYTTFRPAPSEASTSLVDNIWNECVVLFFRSFIFNFVLVPVPVQPKS